MGKYKAISFRRGQAVAEMALFSSLIILVFGVLLSYLQRFNNQQYAQMETFRRALARACTYQGEDSEGAGASVQYTLIQNRRQADLSPNFYKKSPESASGSANIFWAVPKAEEGAEAPSLIVFRVNEDQREFNYRDKVPKEHDSTDDEGDERQRYWVFETEETTVENNSTYNEQSVKNEDQGAITNTRSSDLAENITTTVYYTVKEVDRDDEEYEQPQPNQDNAVLFSLSQNLYQDSQDGQYKYSNLAPANSKIERSKTWQTNF